MSTLLARRRVLSLFAGAGVATLVAACAGTATPPDHAPRRRRGTHDGRPAPRARPARPTRPADGGDHATADASCSPIPEETAGPFPGDGSNGVNVLTESGVVRSDIRASFGASTTVAEGVPLTIDLTIVDTADGCAPLAGAAVYLWHCDREGRYSMYSEGAADENYLRGVQETDADGG